MRALAPLAVLLLVGACVAAPPAPRPQPPAPAPRPVPVPAQPPAADWRDLPYSAGTWTYRRDARGSIALFGAVGTDAALTLRCDLTARQIFLSRAGSAVQPLTIRTSSTTRSLPVQPVGGTVPYVAAALAPTDPILEAMGFSRGRFVVAQAGQATLVLPAWAEIERVTEDCRG
ncbi:hypothetical protein FSB78_00160 [Sphingomonas ginsenosidivorax]|uniref:Lipoprotein n=1 Tax=Sphingomonas ginsenosidivorax TaxID=862135 RepID=A0A5C6UBQ7_9SPHN|nr:hypothetical protein [Sphingomonas ginsenosidivorax]TXC69556.1 hypothetical protein FSB78_00160 [Sphingomonas ginsenosidivorax]